MTVNGKYKNWIFKPLLGLSVILLANVGSSQDMPTGGNVKSGHVTITGTGTNHMVVDQATQKSIINWDSFSIHSGGRVDFNQPSASSFSLNRVQGSMPSSISGQLNSNGKVMLINPNGVAITPNGVVDTGSFTASTLNIKDNDFINDNFSFEGNGRSKGVKNGGKIKIGGGGHAALLGGYVSNTGTVTAKLGKIAMGSGEKITLDFVGDGLMSVTVPSNQLGIIRDVKGRTLESLVNNAGVLKANGGMIKLSAATAKSLSRGAVNIGSTGMVIAKSLKNKPGRVVIGSPSRGQVRVAGNINVSGKSAIIPSGKLYVKGRQITHSGQITANGYSGGKVKILSKENLKLDGKIFAKGKFGKGGSVELLSEKNVISSKNAIVIASGQNKGGTIRSLAKLNNYTSGTYNVNSEAGYGGKIDITGKSVNLEAAKLSAKGNSTGGKIRIGGEYLGGRELTGTVNNKENEEGFVTRFGVQPSIPNAKQTIVKAETNIDVSSKNSKGGTVVVWSDEFTDFNGTINAKGSEPSAFNLVEGSGGYAYSSAKIKSKAKILKTTIIESSIDPPKREFQPNRQEIRSFQKN